MQNREQGAGKKKGRHGVYKAQGGGQVGRWGREKETWCACTRYSEQS